MTDTTSPPTPTETPAPTNEELFRRAYTLKLKGAIEKTPEDYTHVLEKMSIEELVERMIRAFRINNAFVSNAAKAAAKACGIKPSAKAIKEFLTNENQQG